MAAAAALAVALFSTSAASCAPELPEGTSRPLTKEGRAGLASVIGTEIFRDGEWLKHGEFVFYDDGGDEIGRGHYKDGLEDGPWTRKYEDGCTGLGSFKEGRQSGLWQTFHRNGSLQDTGNYERGRRTGTWLSYRDDRTKLREAQYEDGVLNGQVTWFAEDGATVDKNRSGIYRDGELVEY